LLYGDTGEQFIEGEWLVATQPWFGTDGQKQVPVVQNSEEFVVEDKEPSQLYEFDTWVLEISSSPQANDIRHIEVLNRDELPRYNARLEELAEKAKNTGNWSKYYDYKEHFARVDYSYAMTTHKAQGSTFTRTFVDVEDIDTCPNPAEIGRLKYVATTRASDKLVVFDG
jgi:exodeoxyribonuclease-5